VVDQAVFMIEIQRKRLDPAAEWIRTVRMIRQGDHLFAFIQ